MRDFLWCSVTKRVIDAPTVRVCGDDSDSDDDEEENFRAALIGENPEHYVDMVRTYIRVLPLITRIFSRRSSTS